MKPCKKRQKVVKRPSNEVRFRCMNDKCGFMGNVVGEATCSGCPVRIEEHKSPCLRPHRLGLPSAPAKNNASVTQTEEMLNIKDEELREMVTDAGLDIEEFERHVPVIEKDAPSYPPITMQAWLYKEALLRWNKAGRPKRSDEEVKELLEGHCKAACSWFDPKQGRCKGCGCAVSEGSIAIFNKLRMGSEHCPQEKW